MTRLRSGGVWGGFASPRSSFSGGVFRRRRQTPPDKWGYWWVVPVWVLVGGTKVLVEIGVFVGRGVLVAVVPGRRVLVRVGRGVLVTVLPGRGVGLG